MRTKAYLITPAMCATLLFSMANIAHAAEGPYSGTPAPIPGTVQAENYDTGGQGVGYNVTAVNGTGIVTGPTASTSKPRPTLAAATTSAGQPQVSGFDTP